MIIEYATTEFGVKQPTRSNPSDAGLDIYANLKEEVTLEPGQNKMIQKIETFREKLNKAKIPKDDEITE